MSAKKYGDTTPLSERRQTSNRADGARKAIEARALKEPRSFVHYRLNGEPLDGEPDWAGLESTDLLEYRVWGAPWAPALHHRPVMCADNHQSEAAREKGGSATTYRLTEPIWPPREATP